MPLGVEKEEEGSPFGVKSPAVGEEEEDDAAAEWGVYGCQCMAYASGAQNRPWLACGGVVACVVEGGSGSTLPPEEEEERRRSSAMRAEEREGGERKRENQSRIPLSQIRIRGCCVVDVDLAKATVAQMLLSRLENFALLSSGGVDHAINLKTDLIPSSSSLPTPRCST